MPEPEQFEGEIRDAQPEPSASWVAVLALVKRVEPGRETAERRYHFHRTVAALGFSSVPLPNRLLRWTYNAPVSCIHFSETPPYDFAITCSTHVALHDGATGRQLRSIGRFDHVAYSAQMRPDAKLLAAGDHTGTVKVVDTKTKGILRSFREHQASTRAVRWSCSGLQLASGSDDKTLRLWDLPTYTALQVRKGHTDYVRALAASPASQDMWISGSYDHTVRLWDMRQPADSALEVSHGAPVEACLFLPGGGLCVSAGGNEVKVWDILGGGRLLHTLSNHQKTVTCLSLDGTGSRLFSGGLDRHVKIYNLENFKVVHMLKYQAPVLALALSPDNSALIASTTDRVLTVRRRDMRKAIAPTEGGGSIEAGVVAEGDGARRRTRSVRTGTLRYFNRGKTEQATDDSIQVQTFKKKKLAAYDDSLRKFRYGEALDKALASGNPVVVAALLEALVERGGLERALSGRDASGLKPLLLYLCKYMINPRYTNQLLEVVTSLMDIYGDVVDLSPDVLRLFFKLRKQVQYEIGFQKEMMSLLGAMDGVVFAAGAAGVGGRALPENPLPSLERNSAGAVPAVMEAGAAPER